MIRDPNLFFTEYDVRHGAGYPLAFMLVSYVAVAVVPGLLMAVLNLSSPGTAALVVVGIPVAGVALWIVGVVEALAAHAIASLFGSNGVVLTLEAYAFPTLIRSGLFWLPVIGWIPGLYGWYLQIQGLAEFHDMPTGTAAVVAILAAILVLVILIPAIVILSAVLAAFVLDMGSTAPA